MSESVIPDRVKIGSRIKVEEDCGTVKYAGKIPETTGIWLGIDWDDPMRGKHDGTYKGERYFQSQHPLSGSFVRPKNVSFGLGFLAAVQDRYCSDEYASDNVVVHDNVKFEFFFNKVSEQQRSFNTLRELDLYGTGCYGLGPDDKIEGVFSSVTYLSLRGCFINSWPSLAEICQHLPKLKVLVLSETLLKGDEEFSDISWRSFQQVNEVIINSMNFSWNDVTNIMKLFPNVSVLRSCYNIYTTLEAAVSIENLQFLEIQFCNIQNWTEINKLQNLPHLQCLNISNNKIVDIYLHENAFKNLDTLQMSNNLVKSFESINELNKLQSLQILVFRHNSLSSLNDFQPWENIVARVKNLKKIDGIQVDNIERQSCELDYLRIYGFEFVKSGGTQELLNVGKISEQFRSSHPRYEELLKKYGAPYVGDGYPAGYNMKHNIVKVRIKCPQDSTKQEVSKKIPLSMTVQKMKVLVSRLYKLNTESVSLSYTSSTVQNTEIKLSNDFKEIAFYSIENGDTILVSY